MNPNNRRTYKQGDRVSYLDPFTLDPGKQRRIGHVLSNENAIGQVLIEGPNLRRLFHRRDITLVKPREKIIWWVAREWIANAVHSAYIRFSLHHSNKRK